MGSLEACPCRVAVGDLWALGRHRLICGDSTYPAVIGRLLASALHAPSSPGRVCESAIVRRASGIGEANRDAPIFGCGVTLQGQDAFSGEAVQWQDDDGPLDDGLRYRVDVVFADPPYGLGLRYGRAKERVVGDGSASGRFVEAALGIPARDWWVCASPMMIAPALSAFERTGLCRKCGGRILGTNWFVPPRFGNCCNHGVKWGDSVQIPQIPDMRYFEDSRLEIPQVPYIEDDRTFGELMDRAICGSCGRKAAARDLVGFDGLITWDKGRAGLGFMAVRRQTEFLIYRSRRRHKRGDRSESDLWKIAPGPIGRPLRHPSEKPLELVMRALRFSMDVAADSSVPARSEGFATVCDPFAGSGTTILAAEALGMQCLAAEICAEHCAGIIGRWEAETGIPAVMVFS